MPWSIITGTSTTNTNPTNNVRFYSGSFENAKAKAGTEGKLFFVEFYADWCTPCKWMDKTTFKDSKVVAQLNDNYIPLKMDIESHEGTDLKKQYSIRMLPTILIFNSQGRMVERVEKTLSSESLNSLLVFHNNPDNRLVISHNINSRPNTFTNEQGPNLDRLYTQYQMAERFKTNYKVQVGNYLDYSEAHKNVKELKETFEEPIVVLNDYVNNKTHYKVLLGEFKTLEEAESFRKILKSDFHIDSIVY